MTSLDTRNVAKTGLLITIIVTCMLIPVIIIAWISKWIYKSRH